MEIDEVEPVGWGSSFRQRFSFGGGRTYAGISGLEESVWKLLEWADSERLSSNRSETKEKAIRVWLQPLVSAAKQNINLFHNDFKKKVGRISQQEVESLLQLAQVLKRKRRTPGSDDADRCLQLLTSLYQKAPKVYRTLLIRWVVMEFSKKHPPPNRLNQQRDHNRLNQRDKPRPAKTVFKKKRHQLRKLNANILKNSNSPKCSPKNVPINLYSNQSTKPEVKISKLMVGNVKENQKFPPMGWIFPCTICFQPTSNMQKEILAVGVAHGVYVCKPCYVPGKIPQEIRNGTRSNTRVIIP